MNPGAKGGAFFRTMVLMGSSVAMSCGGMTQADGTGGGPHSGGGPSGTGTGGTSTGGTGTGGSGTGGAGSGGLPVGSGGGIILDPGTGGEGYYNFGGAFPTDCPTTQLACAYGSNGCSQYDYHYLTMPGNCVCDSERPENAEDCAEGEGFTCLVASQDVYGQKLDPPVAYNCECVVADASWNGYCYGFCSEHSSSSGSASCNEPGEITEDLQAYLCGCAATILK